MFYRHKDFMESYVHQCADADRYTSEHRAEIAMVRRHDIHHFLVVDVNGKRDTIHIKYCPYCGVDLDKEESTGEMLKLKLL